MEEHKSLLRQKLSVVFQDFAHYETSLRDNITVSDPSRRLSDSGILDMARQIHVEDVILEQPTAALDPLAETRLYQDFSRITGDKTCLLISHRLGITSLVDRILVFQDGRITEDGTHEELMAKKGHYHPLYQAQAKWYQ